LATSFSAPSQPTLTAPSTFKLSEKATLFLDGDLAMRMPATMKPGSPVTGHGGVQRMTSSREEAAARMELDGVGFEMRVYETYARSSDLEHDVRVDAARESPGATVTSGAFGEAWHGYEAIARKGAQVGDGERPLLYAAYVRSSTSTVKIVAFYLDRAGLPYRDGWIALCRRIVATIRNGDEPVDVSAGSRMIGHRDFKLEFSTPVEWVGAATSPVMAGPVSLGYRLRRIGELAQPGPICDLEVGDAVETDVTGHDPLTATTSPGTILGHPVTWRTWTEQAGVLVACDAPGALRSLDVHVACRSTKPEDVAVMRTIMETVQVPDGTIELQPPRRFRKLPAPTP
jgi:hypothetical protein